MDFLKGLMKCKCIIQAWGVVGASLRGHVLSHFIKHKNGRCKNLCFY